MSLNHKQVKFFLNFFSISSGPCVLRITGQALNGFPSVSNRAGFYTTVWRNEENTASLAAGITATSRAMEWWWHVTYCMRTCFCGRGRAPSRLVDFTQRRPKTVRSLMETDRHRPHVHDLE